MVKDFYIKNMVCDRCIKVLKNEIEAQEIKIKEIELGRVQLDIQKDNEIDKLKTIIENNGFEQIRFTYNTVCKNSLLFYPFGLFQNTFQLQAKSFNSF